jgi:AAHS family 4-hydroxybenzoate transporter-like MFS transporter
MDQSFGDPSLPDAVFDVGMRLETGAWSRFQKIVIGLAALAFAVDGLANQALGLAIPALIRSWHVSRAAFAPVAALGLIGVALGAALGGMIADRWGRRLALIGSVVLFGVATALSASCRGIGDLVVLRFIAGLGLGATIPTATSLVAEFTPSRRRSLAVGIALIFIPLGSVASGLIAAKILPAYGWRSFFAVGGLLPLALAAILAATLPESPRFLVRRPERHAQLAALLRRLGYPCGADAVFVDHVHGVPRSSSAALFGAAARRDTIALWGAFFFCLMALYTVFSWAPTMLAGLGFGLAATSSALVAFNIGGIGGAIGSTWLIYRIGSRLTLLGLCFFGIVGAAALALMPIGPAHGLLWLVLAFIFESFCIGGFQNTLYPIAANLYPPFAKATGVGAAAAAGRIGAVASSFTGVLSLGWHGASGYFIVLAAIMAAGLGCASLVTHHIAKQ